MKDRIGPRSSEPPKAVGMASARPRSQDRARQRDLTKSPWSVEGRRHPSSQKATGIENLMRYALLRKGINFVEQASIGPWCVDFYLPEHNACIEADGEYWHSSVSARMKDRRKDAWLKSRGYSIFHFDGWEIKQDSDFCVSRMMKSLNKDHDTDKISNDMVEEDEPLEHEGAIGMNHENDNPGDREQSKYGGQATDDYDNWLSAKI